MHYGKNLTGEKKVTFGTLDITQSLNIDDNGSLLSSGNILSTGKIKAVHGDCDDLFVLKQLVMYECIVFYVEFDEQWTG